MTWIFIIVIIGAIGIGVYIGTKQAKFQKEKVAEGKMITRDLNFMKDAEEFTLCAFDPQCVTEAVKNLDYTELCANMEGSAERQIFKFKGRSWAAQLYRVSENDSQACYRFEFTSWKMDRYMPRDFSYMNMMATAIEKIFLSIDPNTQVRCIRQEIKTKHDFF